jgi:hypothetical protein
MTRIVRALSRGIIAKIFSPPFCDDAIVVGVIRALYGLKCLCVEEGQKVEHIYYYTSPSSSRFYCSVVTCNRKHHSFTMMKGLNIFKKKPKKSVVETAPPPPAAPSPPQPMASLVENIIPELAIFAFCRYSVRCGALPPPSFRIPRSSRHISVWLTLRKGESINRIRFLISSVFYYVLLRLLCSTTARGPSGSTFSTTQWWRTQRYGDRWTCH